MTLKVRRLNQAILLKQLLIRSVLVKKTTHICRRSFSPSPYDFKNSSEAGYSHLLIIEEAHSLPIATLKQLKRFFELEDGYKNLSESS